MAGEELKEELKEDVRLVMREEADALLDVLSGQSEEVLAQLSAEVQEEWAVSWGTLVRRDWARRLMEFYGAADPLRTACFLVDVCMRCEGMPMWLECRLHSVAGSVIGERHPTNHPAPPPSLPPCPVTTRGSSSYSAKRPRIDPVNTYRAAVAAVLRRRYEKLSHGLELRLDRTWVLRRSGTAGSQWDRSSSEPDPPREGEEVDRLPAAALLSRSGGVQVLLGPAGSGKTLLAHWLAWRWAQGHPSRLHLLFLLEFRQLGLLSGPLSLRQLLFRCFLAPEEGGGQAEAVLAFLLAHPERVGFILDGYDEFRFKLEVPWGCTGTWDPDRLLPVAELLSGVCGRHVLPGCQLLITCRPHDPPRLPRSAGVSVAELQGFDRRRVREFAERYLRQAGHARMGEAVSLLLGSQLLLGMARVPVLCRVCCDCLQHMLPGDGSRTAPPLAPPLAPPSSRTQVYLVAISARLRCWGEPGAPDASATPPRPQQEVAALGRLAWTGLHSGRILFPADELPAGLAQFGTETGMLSHAELTLDGVKGQGYTFSHLTLQELLAAAYLMSSHEVSELQLRQQLSLRSRWVARIDPKSVCSDALQLFLCGLATSANTASLALLMDADRVWVEWRQGVVLKVLRGLASSTSLTGPKAMELCRCIHEMMDVQLAELVASKSSFELRNIRLEPMDMDALAFVTSAGRRPGNLDFGGCSMDLECLEALQGCQNLERLAFRSRKYDNKFAEALSSILPKLKTLKMFEFTCGSLSDQGVEALAKALESCPHITHLNFSDNCLTYKGLGVITETSLKLPNITSVQLGKNRICLNGIFFLLERVAASLRNLTLQAEEAKDISIIFPQSVQSTNEGASQQVILNFNLCETHVKDLIHALRSFKGLALLDLSKNSLGNKGLKRLLEMQPKLQAIQQLDVSENGVDMEGLLLLTTALSSCTDLLEVDASHQGKRKLVLRFRQSKRFHVRPSEGAGTHLLRRLSLTHTAVQPDAIKKLCRKLGRCRHQLELDLSHGCLSAEAAAALLEALPGLTGLRLLRLNHVQMSTNEALLLVRSLSDCQHVQSVELRHQGEAFIQFAQVKAERATCRLAQYQLCAGDVEKLCGALEHCSHLADLDLCSSLLSDEGVRRFAEFLPRLPITGSVNLGHNRLTLVGALYLVNAMSTCEKLVSMDISLGEEDQCLVGIAQDNAVAKSLSLRGGHFERSHILDLMDILQRCPNLRTLQLASNSLHPDGLSSLLNNVAMLASIHTLELYCNRLSVSGVADLVEHLSCGSGRRTLRVRELWLQGEVAVQLVAQCLHLNPNIQQIQVHQTTLHISAEGASHSAPGAADGTACASGWVVRHISFSACGLQGGSLSCLGPVVLMCQQLQDLHLSQIRLGQEGAEFLSSVLPSLTNLRRLTVQAEGLESEGFVLLAEGLRHTRNLECLSLSHHVISDEGATALGRSLVCLERLRCLRFSQCSGWTAAGGQALVQGLVCCLSLEEIRLDRIMLDEDSVLCLASGLCTLTSVRALSLKKITAIPVTSAEGGALQQVMTCLQRLTQIEEIEIEGMRIRRREVGGLLKHTPRWVSLRKISVCDMGFSDQEGERLVDALSHCRKLQELRLSRNLLGPACAAQLGHTLHLLPCLTLLDVSENELRADGVQHLAEGLASAVSLTHIQLTSVGSPELESIAACLENFPCEDVSLAWNGCGDSVALRLADVLPGCPRLRRLDLEANNITTTGAKALAMCLPSCPSVEVIRLWRNAVVVNEEEILKDPRLSFSST